MPSSRFGQWRSDLTASTIPVGPLDRFPNVPPVPAANSHFLLPFETLIKAGGAVTFLISGLHQILV